MNRSKLAGVSYRPIVQKYPQGQLCPVGKGAREKIEEEHYEAIASRLSADDKARIDHLFRNHHLHALLAQAKMVRISCQAYAPRPLRGGVRS